jgi:hypothetical protein
LLDSKGKLVKRITNTLKAKNIVVFQLFEFYLIITDIRESSVSIFGRPIAQHKQNSAIYCLLDRNLKYVKHKIVNHSLTSIASSDSNIFCIDDEKFYLYDMDLELVTGRPLNKIKKKIGDYSNQFVMSNFHLFMMCDHRDGKVLRIFDLQTCDLVKEFDVKADNIKLVSTSYLILWDRQRKILHLYDQSDDFEKLDQVDMRLWLDCDQFSLSTTETSSTLLFCGRSQAKTISFNQIFPLIPIN